MDIRIIKSPSAGTMQILRQRITDGATGDFVNAAAVEKRRTKIKNPRFLYP